MNDLDILLARLPVEDKAKVFDALVREFQGHGRFVGHHRVMVCPPPPVSVTPPRDPPTKLDARFIYKDVPLYDFKLRVAGHSDFLMAILKLAKVDTV